MRRVLSFLPFVPLAGAVAFGTGVAIWMELWRGGRSLWDEKETWL